MRGSVLTSTKRASGILLRDIVLAFNYSVCVRWIQIWTKWIVILVSAIVCLVAVALVKPLFFVGLVIITRGQHNLAFLVGVDEGRFW